MALDAILAGDAENPEDTVAALKARSAALKQTKKQVQKQLRNAQRRNSRLKQKAKLLSDADLLSVIRMRREKRAKDDAEALANPTGASGDADSSDCDVPAGTGDVQASDDGADAKAKGSATAGDA